MSTPTKSEYMLLFRGTDWHKNLSPEEIQRVVNQMKAWFDRLTAEGKAKAGKPLFHEGKIVSPKRGRMLTDGPFAESKEAIGGFFLLEVGSLDEAAEIARDFPCLRTVPRSRSGRLRPSVWSARLPSRKVRDKRACAPAPSIPDGAVVRKKVVLKAVPGGHICLRL